jgi:cell division protein FtsA
VTANLARNGRTAGIMGLLDIGTAKTACLIVTPEQGLHGMRVLGAGLQPSRGLKAGTVIELDAVEHTVRGAVAAAERASGVTLREVFVSATCGRLKSSSFVANARIEGRVVTEADVERLMGAARTFAERDGRALLHMDCLAYRVDDTAGLHDPLGLAGRTLSADLVAVTADDAPLRNLQHVVERTYLSVAGLVPALLASGVAATTEEERQLGVISVDMGAGTTSLAMFAEGHLVAADVVPVGGNHITFDIARALSAPLLEAERIKQDYGTLAKAACDHHELISYTLAGEEAPALYQTTAGEVRNLVRARVRALFEHVAERIERTGLASQAPRRMVLTCGTSQLPGIGEVAAEHFSRPVRVASGVSMAGMPPGCGADAFSTAAGMAQVVMSSAVAGRGGRSREGLPDRYLQRVGQWLRESF